MALHSTLTGTTIHSIVSFTYSNYSDLTGASGFESNDIGKVALESDNGTYWILVNTDPTWVQIGIISCQSLSSDSSLTTGPTTYFVNNSDPFTSTLPNPSLMTGIPITFICTQNVGETWFQISPFDGENIEGSNSDLYMNGPASVTLVSDGTNWWITSSYGME